MFDDCDYHIVNSVSQMVNANSVFTNVLFSVRLPIWNSCVCVKYYLSAGRLPGLPDPTRCPWGDRCGHGGSSCGLPWRIQLCSPGCQLLQIPLPTNQQIVEIIKTKKQKLCCIITNLMTNRYQTWSNVGGSNVDTIVYKRGSPNMDQTWTAVTNI